MSERKGGLAPSPVRLAAQRAAHEAQSDDAPVHRRFVASGPPQLVVARRMLQSTLWNAFGDILDRAELGIHDSETWTICRRQLLKRMNEVVEATSRVLTEVFGIDAEQAKELTGEAHGNGNSATEKQD